MKREISVPDIFIPILDKMMTKWCQFAKFAKFKSRLKIRSFRKISNPQHLLTSKYEKGRSSYQKHVSSICADNACRQPQDLLRLVHRKHWILFVCFHILRAQQFYSSRGQCKSDNSPRTKRLKFFSIVIE